jgi:hypothetical protein
MQPLSPEDIWGVPAEQLPAPAPRDYFDYLEQADVEVTDDDERDEQSEPRA